MTSIIVYALLVASISFTITVTSIFKEIREFISLGHPKLEELIHCPWCLGHWIMFLVVFLGEVYPFTKIWIVDLFFTSFTAMSIVGIIHYVLLRAYKLIAESMTQRNIDKLN
jgi:hypothetical protein